MSKKTLCLDFDGVIHSYASPWQGIATAADPPTPGAADFLYQAIYEYGFRVAIFSSRSVHADGIACMQRYIHRLLTEAFGEDTADGMLAQIVFPVHKPASFVSLDDRAITFTGQWPDLDALASFVPWNKLEKAEEAEGSG